MDDDDDDCVHGSWFESRTISTITFHCLIRIRFAQSLNIWGTKGGCIELIVDAGEVLE